MTSKTSFPERWYEFCQTYRWSLKKNIGMMILLAVLLFVALPMLLMITIPREIDSYSLFIAKEENAPSQIDDLNKYVQNFIHMMVPYVVITLVLLFGLILCMILFNYMQKKRSVDLFHALPVGRTPMLLGRWCAGLTIMFVPVIFNFLIVGIICASYGITLKESLIIVVLRIILMGTLAFTSAMFMAVCSGTMFDTILSIVGVNAGYPLMIFLGGSIVPMILPGMSFDFKNGLTLFLMTAFSPYASAYAAYVSSVTSVWFYVWWIVLTAVLLWGSVALYGKRKSESAEDNLVFPIPKVIIRFLLTAAGGLALGTLLSIYSSSNFFIGVVVGSLLVHVVVEALYSRGFQHIWKSFAWYGVFAVAFVVFYGIIATGFFGYDTRVPNVSEVQSVTVERSGYTEDESMPANTVILDEHGAELKRLQPVIQNPNNIQKVIDTQNKLIQAYRLEHFPYMMENSAGCSSAFSYHLKNGKNLTRKYQYYDRYQDERGNKLEQQTRSVAKMPEYLESSDMIFYLEPDYISSVGFAPVSGSKSTISVSEENIPELLNALRQDYLNGKLNTCSQEDCLSVNISPKKNFIPAGRLKSILGNYSGMVHFDYWQDYNVSDKNSATYKLAKKLGWR